MTVRVRIAPSPTGNLHVGTARTALFNYLFAKRYGGQFILRIEDTDLERSNAAYTQNIYDSLRALNLSWDEGPDVGGPYGPYQQSDRLALYAEWAQKLVATGHAYPCYCTAEELDAERAQAMADKRPYIYSRRCLNPETAATLAQDPSRTPTLRFRIPDERGDVVFQDAVRGELRFDTGLIGDFVLMKSNGTPSYNFAVVMDDLLMQISHVIRGEDHISNTPKQLLLFEALGVPAPAYAHVGMILAPDRSKLSKRHGATAVSEFIAQGYLPEAFCNFLTLLGWSPPDGQEVASLSHFAEAFSLDRIAQNPAIFDIEKLNWLNSLTIRQLPLDELLERARPFLADFDLTHYSHAALCDMLDAVREPITILSDLPEAVSYFFGQNVNTQGVEDVLNQPETLDVLKAFEQTFLPTAPFDQDAEAMAAAIKAFANSLKPLKMKTVMWAIRASVTGRTHGADLSKTMMLLGKETVFHRVNTALLNFAR
jgi:nondiscriminating glutamyl-tRNA synthetase